MDLVVAVMWGHFQRQSCFHRWHNTTAQLLQLTSTMLIQASSNAFHRVVQCFPWPLAAVPPCRRAAVCQTFTEVDATYCTYTCKFYENPICGGPPSFWGVSSSKKHGQILDRNGQLTWKQGETQKRDNHIQAHTITMSHFVTRNMG